MVKGIKVERLRTFRIIRNGNGIDDEQAKFIVASDKGYKALNMKKIEALE